MNKIAIKTLDELEDRQPAYALVGEVDLCVVRYDDNVSVFYGRCLHRGALMADGYVDGENLICGVHYWDYRLDTGVSEYNNAEILPKFASWVEDGQILVDADEIGAWEEEHPQPFKRDEYLGLYADTAPRGRGAPCGADPGLRQGRAQQDRSSRRGRRHGRAAPGPAELGRHSVRHGAAPPHAAPRRRARRHRSGDRAQRTEAAHPGDSAPGLGHELRGALRACQGLARAGRRAFRHRHLLGEGGMLPEEQQACSRYFYEYASGRFGFSWDKLENVQAFHFKGGQGAKTGTGGHLPGNKVRGKIAQVRGLPEGSPAVSPPRFPDWTDWRQVRDFADEVRSHTGGIPIGYKLSAQHIEKDIDAALEVGVDYIILDGRGGGTGAAPSSSATTSRFPPFRRSHGRGAISMRRSART